MMSLRRGEAWSVTLDRDAIRIDLSVLVKACRHDRHAALRLRGKVHPLRYDEYADVLEVGDLFEIAFVRVMTRLRGRAVRGARLTPCPAGCGSRVRVLWLPWGEELPKCRVCAGVRYATSETHDEALRAMYAWRNAKMALEKHERRALRASKKGAQLQARLSEARRRVGRAVAARRLPTEA